MSALGSTFGAQSWRDEVAAGFLRDSQSLDVFVDGKSPKNMENWGLPQLIFGNFGKMENLHIKTDEHWWKLMKILPSFICFSWRILRGGSRRPEEGYPPQARSICHVSWCSHVHFEDDLGNWGVSFSISSLAMLFPATLSKWTRRERRSRKVPASPLMVCLTRWKTMMVGSENPWENHLKIRRSVALEIGIQCTPKSPGPIDSHHFMPRHWHTQGLDDPTMDFDEVEPKFIAPCCLVGPQSLQITKPCAADSPKILPEQWSTHRYGHQISSARETSPTVGHLMWRF